MKKNRNKIAIGGSLAAAVLLPAVIQSNYNQILLNQTLVYIIVALGLNFTMGLSGSFDFSVAAVFGLGSYTTALLTTRLGVNPWAGVLAAVCVGALVGLILGVPSLRLKGIYFVLATLGFLEIVRQLLSNMTWLTGGTNGVANIPSLEIFGLSLKNTKVFYYAALLFLLAGIGISYRIIYSKWGRTLIAIKDNEVAVDGCGIDKASFKIKAYMIGSCFTAFAGAMNAHLFQFVHPADFTFDFTVKFIMMLMLGGLGTIPGCILGGMIVTLLPEALKFLGEYYWLAFSILMLVMMMFVPYGVVSVPGLLGKWMKRMGGKRRNG